MNFGLAFRLDFRSLWSCFWVPWYRFSPAVKLSDPCFRGPCNIWSCFVDRRRYNVQDRAKSDCVLRTMQHLVASWDLNRLLRRAPFSGPNHHWVLLWFPRTTETITVTCFRARFNIIGFYRGSPARQKQSNHVCGL